MIILYPYLYIFPNQDNISLFPEVLSSDNYLLRLLEFFFGIGLSRRYDIGSYIPYEPLYIVSYFHYIKEQTEETGKCSHPHLYRWGFPARLKSTCFCSFRPYFGELGLILISETRIRPSGRGVHKILLLVAPISWY